MTQYLRIAALGSSFAAGPGIEPVADRIAGRSGRNYPHVLAELLNAELTDLTVSGATTGTILDTSQVTFTGETVPPQIDGLPEDAELVTVTAGGNDLHLASSLLFASLSQSGPNHPVATMIAQELGGRIPTPTEATVQAMADGLVAIADRIRAVAPSARVVLVDYLTVIGVDAEGIDNLPFAQGEAKQIRQIEDAVAHGFEIASDAAGVDLVRASELSVEHGLGAVEPWVFGFESSPERVGSSFHPNAEGMRAVAEAVYSALGD